MLGLRLFSEERHARRSAAGVIAAVRACGIGNDIRCIMGSLAREASKDSRSRLPRRVHGVHVFHLHAGVVAVSTTESLLLAWRIVPTTSGQVVDQCIVIPALKRDAFRIEPYIISNSDNPLVTLLANNDASVTPRKVILVPERVDRKDEAVYRVRHEVNDHPADVLPLSLDNEDDGLQAIHGSKDDNGEQRELAGVCSDKVDQVGQICAGGRKDDCSKQIDKDDESHAEAAESTEVVQEDQLSKIMDGRVDPATSLR